MLEVYLAAAGRSAIGGLNGALAKLSAVEMGSQVIRQLLARYTMDSALVDEVILGHVLSAGCGQNTARQASIRAGIGVMTPAMTINKVCGSGLKAVHLGAQAIALDDAQLIVAGGMGTVTAGNASGLNDGAAAVVLCNAAMLQRLGLTPLARIRAWARAVVDPAIMGIGPVSATRRRLRKAGWTVGDLDLIEANEAFAVQTLAVSQELQWNPDKVNLNGGAIALGHPIGASGCRVLVTLLHEMIKRDAHKGLATLCIGGGQGVAIAVER